MTIVYEDNTKRIVSDLVSVDTWYIEAERGSKTHHLYADISFRSAFVGGDDDSGVIFDMKLERAEVAIAIGDGSRVRIPKLSLVDLNSKETLTMDESLLDKSSSDQNSGLTLSLMGTKSQVSPSASADLSKSKTTNQGLEKSVHKRIELSNSGGIVSNSRISPDGDYTWELTPALGDHLSGKPWPRNTKLFDIVNEDGASMDDLNMKLTVTCRNGDLQLDNFQIKEDGFWEKNFRTSSAKLAIARQYVQKCLTTANLEYRDIENPYCSIQLADILISSAR